MAHRLLIPAPVGAGLIPGPDHAIGVTRILERVLEAANQQGHVGEQARNDDGGAHGRAEAHLPRPVSEGEEGADGQQHSVHQGVAVERVACLLDRPRPSQLPP